MTRPPLTEILSTRSLLGDGDLAAALLAIGKTPPPGPPAAWTAAHRDELLEAHQAYMETGCDCLTVPLPVLQLLRDAAGADRYILTPISAALSPEETVQHAIAALRNGADALLLEEFHSLEHLTTVTTTIRDAAPIAVIASFCFTRSAAQTTGTSALQTCSGVSPESAAASLLRSGASGAALTGGAGTFPEDFTSLVAAFRARTDLPIVVYLPAGPIEADGHTVTRPDPPELLADHAWPLIRSGANLLAGGPGTTPEHLSLLREELDRL